MTFDYLSDLNWLAVLAAAAAFFVLGAIWYAPPLFGKMWQESMGMRMEEGQGPDPKIFVVTFIAYAVAGVATAMLAAATGSDTVMEGLVLGVVTGVGFAGTLTLVGMVYEQRPKPGTWFAITSVYNLLGFIVLGIIVSIWD